MSQIYYYLPQLDFAVSEYWNSVSGIKIEHVNLPVTMDETKLQRDSLFDLMFNKAYNKDYYYYKFKRRNINTIDNNILTRLLCKDTIPIVYVSCDDSSESENILNITEEEKNLLDELLLFRMNSNCNIENYNYEKLESPLSKLLYIYLNFFYSNNHFESYETVINFELNNDDRIFVSLFYLFVLNEIHNRIIDLEVLVGNDIVKKYMYRLSVKVEEETDVLELTNIVIPVEKIVVYLNGSYLPESAYSAYVNEEKKELRIEFNKNLVVNDNVIVDYVSITYVKPTSVISSQVVNEYVNYTLNVHKLVS